MPAQASVSVPATSANLGSGFDAFGLALALHNRFSAELADEWSVEVSGEGAGRLSTGPANRVARAMARVFDAAGKPGQAARLSCENRIPPGAGLGSSAAAAVGGILLADALVGAALDRQAILELASEIEGHPDNAAAALFGGFTVCWSDGAPRCLRVEPSAGLAAVVVGSDAPLPTHLSRTLLPESVPHADAAFSAGRAGLLAAGIALGDIDAIAAGLSDRIHEPYRAQAVADLAEVRSALLDAGAAGAVLSGAGPTVIGLVSGVDDVDALGRAEQVASGARARVAKLAGRRTPLALGIERAGATLL